MSEGSGGRHRRATDAGGVGPNRERPDSALPTLTIVFPALNEEAGIAQAVQEAMACGDRLITSGVIDRVEVVVVDDGSTDATAKILWDLRSTHDDLVIVSHPVNRGLGAAVRSGLDAAGCDLIFYTDADLPVDLAIVDDGVRLLGDREDVDVVSWYRLRRWEDGPRRLLYSVGYNGLVWAALGLRVRDVNFAAKLFRSEALHGLELRSEGSFIDAELLARLDRRGCRMIQRATIFRPRLNGQSTLSSPSVIRHIMREMRALTPDIRRERRPAPS